MYINNQEVAQIKNGDKKSINVTLSSQNNDIVLEIVKIFEE